jgi:hypothetical protein
MAIVKYFEPSVKPQFHGGYPPEGSAPVPMGGSSSAPAPSAAAPSAPPGLTPAGLLVTGKRLSKAEAEGTVEVINANGEVVNVTLPIAD